MKTTANTKLIHALFIEQGLFLMLMRYRHKAYSCLHIPAP